MAWPAALTAGGMFAIMQFLTSNYISTQLTDIVAALVSAGSVVALLQIWSPHTPGARQRRRWVADSFMVP
jgi:lactate permease